MVKENPEPGFVTTVLNGSQKIVLDHYNWTKLSPERPKRQEFLCSQIWSKSFLWNFLPESITEVDDGPDQTSRCKRAGLQKKPQYNAAISKKINRAEILKR